MKSVVLLSAGLDSTINAYEAHRAGGLALALTFDYGQRAAAREVASAQKTASLLGVAHIVVPLPWFKEFTQTSLVNRAAKVPTHVQIDNLGASETSAKSVWVPNRNGIFLNIAAAFAEGMGADTIIPGFNIEEAATFPDNTQGYLDALTAAFCFSTANHVRAFSYTTSLNKTQIVRRGLELGVRFEHVWPCYLGEALPCGTCESCLRYQRACRDGGL